MDSVVFKPCPRLDLRHGFLRKIQHNITSSKEDLEAELNRRVAQETAQKAEKKKKRRPSIQIYRVPARRSGANYDTYSGIPYLPDLTKERTPMFFDDDQRPVEVEETTYSNHVSACRKTFGSTSSSSGGAGEETRDLREHLNNIRKSKKQLHTKANGLPKEVDAPVTSNQYDIVKMETRTEESLDHSEEAHSEVRNIVSETAFSREIKREKIETPKSLKVSFVPIKIKLEARTEEYGSGTENGHSEVENLASATTFVKEEVDLQKVKVEKTSDITSPAKQSEEQRHKLPQIKVEKRTTEKSSTKKSLRQCTLPKLPQPAQDLAEQTLLKSLSRAKHDAQNGHWTIGDSCLVMETIKDPSSVSEESLRRVAMALVTNSLLSDMCHFRMVQIALVIIQKEKTLSESRGEQRFVDALLLACVNHRRSAESHALPTLIPFISFTSLLYCCDAVRQTLNTAWAELLCDLYITFILGLSNLTEAEKFFSLLCKTGPHLQKDTPSQFRELFRTVKTVFLADKTDDTVKDILLDLIEVKAGGWKRI